MSDRSTSPWAFPALLATTLCAAAAGAALLLTTHTTASDRVSGSLVHYYDVTAADGTELHHDIVLDSRSGTRYHLANPAALSPALDQLYLADQVVLHVASGSSDVIALEAPDAGGTMVAHTTPAYDGSGQTPRRVLGVLLLLAAIAALGAALTLRSRGGLALPTLAQRGGHAQTHGPQDYGPNGLQVARFLTDLLILDPPHWMAVTSRAAALARELHEHPLSSVSLDLQDAEMTAGRLAQVHGRTAAWSAAMNDAKGVARRARGQLGRTAAAPAANAAAALVMRDLLTPRQFTALFSPFDGIVVIDSAPSQVAVHTAAGMAPAT